MAKKATKETKETKETKDTAKKAEGDGRSKALGLALDTIEKQ